MTAYQKADLSRPITTTFDPTLPGGVSPREGSVPVRGPRSHSWRRRPLHAADLVARSRNAFRVARRELLSPGHRLGLVIAAIWVASILCWLSSLGAVDVNDIGGYGLVSVLPWQFFAALGGLTVGFALCVRRGAATTWYATFVAGLITILHGTLPLLYNAPRFAFVYKHLGVVDLVARYGSVDRTIDAYNNWPGFFLLNAYFREAAGLSDSLGYTPWAPVFFNACFVVALLLVYRGLGASTAARWTGVWLFLIGNWVGQDYLAPQALAFLLFLTCVGVCLLWTPRAKLALRPWWLRRRRAPLHLRRSEAPVRRWFAARWFPPLVAERQAPARPLLASLLVLTLFAAIVASHQLTPVMCIAVVSVLLVVARRRGWWLPVAMVLMTGLWTWLVAGQFLATHLYLVGRVGSSPTAVTPTQMTTLSEPGPVFVARVARAMTALLWTLAIAGLLHRWRTGHRSWSVGALIAAPFPLLLAASYGGEMLFRVYLFSLPWVALAGAWLVVDLLARPRVVPLPLLGSVGEGVPHPLARLASARWVRRVPRRSLPARVRPVAAVVLLCTTVLAWCVAAYGQEQANHIRKGDVDAAVWFYDNAPNGSLLMLLNGNFPARLEGNYARFGSADLFSYREYRRYWFTASDVPRLKRIIEGETYASMAERHSRDARAFVAVSTSQIEYAELYGQARPAQVQRFEDVLKASGLFDEVYQTRDARIYELKKVIKR